jgi:hypothetical protein
MKKSTKSLDALIDINDFLKNHSNYDLKGTKLITKMLISLLFIDINRNIINKKNIIGMELFSLIFIISIHVELFKFFQMNPFFICGFSKLVLILPNLGHLFRYHRFSLNP